MTVGQFEQNKKTGVHFSPGSKELEVMRRDLSSSIGMMHASSHSIGMSCSITLDELKKELTKTTLLSESDRPTTSRLFFQFFYMYLEEWNFCVRYFVCRRCLCSDVLYLLRVLIFIALR